MQDGNGLHLDERDLRNECSKVVIEIKPHVSFAQQSETLEASFSIAHINIRTKEDLVMCVRLTVRGFEVGLDLPLNSYKLSFQGDFKCLWFAGCEGCESSSVGRVLVKCWFDSRLNSTQWHFQQALCPPTLVLLGPEGKVQEASSLRPRLALS